MDGGGNQAGRRVASIAVAALGAVLLLLGGVAFYASRAIFDSEQFAKRAADALQDDRVSQRLAQAFVEELVENAEPDLINARPVLQSATEFVVSSGAFRVVFREAAERAHRTLFTRERDSLVLNLADGTNLAIDAVASVSPQIAKQIPKDLQPRLNEIVESDFAIELVQAGERLRFLSIVLPLLGLLALGGSVMLDTNRRRGGLTAAVAVAIAAAGGFALLLVARALVVGRVDIELQDAARGAWEAYLGDLSLWLLIATGASLLVAAALVSRWRADPLAPLRRFGEVALRTPSSVPARAGRAVLVVALGAFFIFSPNAAMSVVAVAAGAYAVFYALTEIMALLAPPAAERPSEPLARRLPLRSLAAVAVVAVVAVTVTLIATGGEGGRRHNVRAPGSIERCNGFAELCDRTLNEVTFPAVHNAMSSADAGFLLPNNEGDVPQQLEAGARALLIDAHWGIRGDDLVVTDLQAEGGEGKAREEAIKATSEEFVQTAERLIERIGTGQVGQGQPEVYWCHVFCELGATPAVKLLEQVGDFLDTHPDEVVILFIEDYVAPAAMAKAFERADLLDYVYTHQRDEPLPTLRQMIAADRRLFVMAENTGGGTELQWYHPGFELAQETPYTFTSAAELEDRSSCDTNRGTTDNPLFQLNHWVEAVPRSPKTAARVNALPFLLARAERCDRERGLLSNILAVDYWEEGDLFEVSRRLNGLPAGAEPEYAETG